MVSGIALLTLTLSLAGCDWNQVGYDAGQTGLAPNTNTLNASNVAALGLKWGASTVTAGAPQISAHGSLIYAGGLEPNGDSSALVRAFNRTDGSLAWQAGGTTVSGTSQCLTVNGDRGIAPTWTMNGLIATSLYHGISCTSGAGSGYDMTAGYQVLDLTTGAVKSQDVNDVCAPTSPSCATSADHLVADPVVGDDGTVYLVTQSVTGFLQNGGVTLNGGAVHYTFNPASGTPMLTAPAISDTTVFVSQSDGHVLAFDKATGNPLWSATVAGAGAPSTDGTSVYVTGNGKIWALDAVTGAVRWSQDASVGTVQAGMPGPASPVTPSPEAPAIAYGRVYVSTSGNVQAFDTATGSETWQALMPTAPGFNGHAPVVANGIIYLGGADQLAAFAADGSGSCAIESGSPIPVCSPLMTRVLAGIASRPIVLDDAVAVGAATSSTTGEVSYFALPSH